VNCPYQKFLVRFAAATALLLLLTVCPCCAGAATDRPLLMTHYMPWYASPPVSPEWGWHWTMKHFDPEVTLNGTREAASHYYPLIGLYDSDDPAVLECHVLLMKLAGIDGAIIDWYGTDDYLDYAVNHRNTLRMVELIHKAGLRFAIMYEDQTVKKAVEGKVLAAPDAVAHGQVLMKWVDQHWFRNANYLKLNGRPVFMVFGPQYYKDDEWNELFKSIRPSPLFFTLQNPRGTAAAGGFGWPRPKDGTAQSIEQLSDFYERAKSWKFSIPAAYPRFHDIYQEANVRPSWGSIDDFSGKTYKDTLEMAIESHPSVIQLVTFNDWGEGTQIEPSVEFGYRDLEFTQRCRRQIEPSFPFKPQDLRLPVQLCNLRHQFRDNREVQQKLDRISREIFHGDVRRAWLLMSAFEQPHTKPTNIAF
jgi:Glycosyl hydrolase family 99